MRTGLGSERARASARVGVSAREAALEEQRASRARPAEPPSAAVLPVAPDAPREGHTIDPAQGTPLCLSHLPLPLSSQREERHPHPAAEDSPRSLPADRTLRIRTLLAGPFAFTGESG